MAFSDRIADFFFPNRCPFCGAFIPYKRLCCDDCASKLVKGNFCIKCGRTPCVCDSAGFLFDGCAVLIPYVGTGREGVLNFKYHKGFNAAKMFVPELYKMLDKAGYLSSADLITAVPMTRSRKNQTGYNHAEYIAKLLSKQCGLPCDFNLIRRNKGSYYQHDLSAAERAYAAKKSYYPNQSRDISGKTVILCDDIITTGSTLSCCAESLKSIGAKNVYCAVIAGTVFEDYKNKDKAGAEAASMRNNERE